jgi:hypothetical protein
VESGVGSGFPLYLLVLRVSGCEVKFEVSPSFSVASFSFQRRQALTKCPVGNIFAYTTLICCEGPMGTPPASELSAQSLICLKSVSLAAGDPRLVACARS